MEHRQWGFGVCYYLRRGTEDRGWAFATWREAAEGVETVELLELPGVAR